MNQFFKLSLKIVQIIMGLLVVYALSILILNNAIFNIFDFKKSNGKIISIKKQENDIYLVKYSYKVKDKEIVSSKHIWGKLLFKNNKPVKFNVCYNKIFPKINKINDFNLIGGYFFGLIVTSMMLIFFILIDLFADKNKWINRYKKFFRKSKN